jgi:RNA polymerase sigma-70 factor (ECF subfamily)
MEPTNNKEREFRIIIDNFAQFIRVLVRQYQLYKFGLDPEDIAQDVNLRIWKLVRSEKKISNYSSYIKKIVSSSVIDHLRKFRREKGLYNHEKQIRIAEMELSYNKGMVRYKNLEESIGKAVELLIDSRRQVVKLYLLNLNIREIADYLNWSQDKTRNLLYRGLKDLKKVLRDMDIHYENGSR